MADPVSLSFNTNPPASHLSYEPSTASMPPAKSQSRNFRACFVGAGYVGEQTHSSALSRCMANIVHPGSLSAIVLARKNPRLQVDVVDRNANLINSWDSHTYGSKFPIQEYGLEDLLYTCSCTTSSTGSEARRTEKCKCASQRIKLRNLQFSTDVAAKIHAAKIIFLCVDTPSAVCPPIPPEASY